jgi:hypothetical protein
MDSDPVALAGTIGTWAAVLIALLALIAVLGPILVWAASRTERNKALHAAGDANQPFIGSGFHFVGFDVRIFRRVKAPITDKVPDNFALQFDPGRYTETKSRATWVQFANLLRGYGATFLRGDNLCIHRGKAILPAHRIWILAVGLTGRYSARPPQVRRRLTMSVTGVRFEEGSAAADDLSILWTVWKDLNGLTGQMRMTDKVPGLGFADSCIILFSPRPASELTGFEPDRISLDDLFMLAIGCQALPSDDYFSLVDLWSNDDVQPEVDETSEFGRRLRPLQSVFTTIISQSDPTTAPLTPSLITKNSRSRAQIQLLEADDPMVLKLARVAHWDDEIERIRVSSNELPQDVMRSRSRHQARYCMQT